MEETSYLDQKELLNIFRTCEYIMLYIYIYVNTCSTRID